MLIIPNRPCNYQYLILELYRTCNIHIIGSDNTINCESINILNRSCQYSKSSH